jgi:hypothetical protein
MELINKASMYNGGKKKALEGAFIEKYHYSIEKRLLNKFDTDTIYPGNTRISTLSLTSLDDNPFHFHYFDQDDIYIEDIDMYLKRENNDDVPLSSSKISIVDSKEQSLHVPFKEVKEEPKLMSFKDKVSEKCTILTFYLTTSVKSAQDDTHYTIRTYSDTFKVAVNHECYVYIVQCADGTLPIILVSKTLVEDVEDLIFEGNIKDGVFNSYFHPHIYQKQQVETIENVVYGKPYDGFNKLEFSEEIVGDEYITNDKLKCRKDGPVRIVSLNGYDFATYRKDDSDPVINELFKEETDMESIDFINFIKSIDLFNSLNEVEKTVSYEYLVDNYQVISKISNMIPVLPIENIEEDERFDIIYLDDPDKFIVRFEDYSDDNFFNLIINIIDGNMCEVYYNIDDREFYMIYYNGYSVTISIKEDEEGATVLYNGTPRRLINQSKDCTLYTYKENYWINCDHSGHIINTNLPIEGTMEKYNMFGVPESF